MCGDGGIEGKEEEEEEVIPPTPVPKEWDCLGSDIEIKEGFMEPERPLVNGLLVTCLLLTIGAYTACAKVTVVDLLVTVK